MTYIVRRTRDVPALDGNWHSPVWQQAETLTVAHFRPESSAHYPHTQARLLHNDDTIFVLFRVQDAYVRSLQTEYCGPVCTDSCVEWFAQPRTDKGYINFEINCGGTLHCSYVADPTRTPDGFKSFEYVPQEWAQRIRIYHSLPTVVEPEHTGDIEWFVEYHVPLALFEHYTGTLGSLSGREWRVNFYKCADHTSHPHWAAWSPVQELNFHRPQDFAPMRFE